MSNANFQSNNSGEEQNLLVLPTGVELGRYRIIRTLGQGGFGITYLAEVIGTDEQVVIKENLPTFCAMRNPGNLQVAATNPNDELREYDEYLKRFVDEARLLAQLSHPNIVKVLGAFEALGTAYYVMPWVGGKELQKAAPASAAITESWLLPILRTLLSTLEYLHGNNIYHRDVKPHNILLTKDAKPVLIDFGTARAIISDRSATHVGTPGYSPIEQLRTKGKRGPWSDVYSLGATCYRLITGERPPEAFDRMDEDEDPLRPLAPRAELRGRFSPVFLATIDKALAQRGKDRWQTATEWLAALPVPATQPTPRPTAGIHTSTISVFPELSPRPRRNVALILLILVLALGIPGGYMLYQHAQTVAEQRLLALQEAERKAREEAQRKLREKGISESQYNSKIVETAKNGDTELLALLITAGADVSAVDKDGNTPLYLAAWEGHVECVRLLLAAPGIDVNNGNKDGSNPLFKAACCGHVECVKLLLAAPGIDVNKRNQHDRTPLSRAAREGRTECVRLLLSAAGIDVNVADSNGDTALYNAIHYNHYECVRLLLSAPGIDVNKADMYGRTPLIDAAGYFDPRGLRLLLSAPGIDVNKADNDGKTPLYEAASRGHIGCVKLLLAAPGINVNKADNDGKTPLKAAEENNKRECARLICEAGGK